MMFLINSINKKYSDEYVYQGALHVEYDVCLYLITNKLINGSIWLIYA
jgi:hypothetical protein